MEIVFPIRVFEMLTIRKWCFCL